MGIFSDKYADMSEEEFAGRLAWEGAVTEAFISADRKRKQKAADRGWMDLTIIVRGIERDTPPSNVAQTLENIAKQLRSPEFAAFLKEPRKGRIVGVGEWEVSVNEFGL
jgi:hypothetical protein